MRIGCLQFAPKLGDVDNNLTRADAVLKRSNAEHLDLDLLVLPEMAFSGYNFKSLRHISPYLEPTGSGISSLWARTTAMKHDCTVVVGYPEKVDMSGKWPCGPEYYNSALMVNADGETVANYRKHHLYTTDETWALEGKAFHGDFVQGLGDVAMGICMDINPQRFEAPWHAFEFAYHILQVQANVVILSMAWVTWDNDQWWLPKDPDMETLSYWVSRLEPLIRSNHSDEIIVIFANRTGQEEEATYTGTSTVLGIHDGEVTVYGLLGRGEKDLLVIDTEDEPLGKLVYRPEPEPTTAIDDEPASAMPRSSRNSWASAWGPFTPVKEPQSDEEYRLEQVTQRREEEQASAPAARVCEEPELSPTSVPISVPTAVTVPDAASQDRPAPSPVENPVSAITQDQTPRTARATEEVPRQRPSPAPRTQSAPLADRPRKASVSMPPAPRIPPPPLVADAPNQVPARRRPSPAPHVQRGPSTEPIHQRPASRRRTSPAPPVPPLPPTDNWYQVPDRQGPSPVPQTQRPPSTGPMHPRPSSKRGPSPVRSPPSFDTLRGMPASRRGPSPVPRFQSPPTLGVSPQRPSSKRGSSPGPKVLTSRSRPFSHLPMLETGIRPGDEEHIPIAIAHHDPILASACYSDLYSAGAPSEMASLDTDTPASHRRDLWSPAQMSDQRILSPVSSEGDDWRSPRDDESNCYFVSGSAYGYDQRPIDPASPASAAMPSMCAAPRLASSPPGAGRESPRQQQQQQQQQKQGTYFTGECADPCAERVQRSTASPRPAASPKSALERVRFEGDAFRPKSWDKKPSSRFSEFWKKMPLSA